MADHNCLSNDVFASAYIPLVLPSDSSFNNSCDWIFCLTLAHALTHMLEQEGGHTFTHAHIRVTFLAGVKSRDCSRVHSSWNTSNTLPVCQRNHKGLDTHTHTHAQKHTHATAALSVSQCVSHTSAMLPLDFITAASTALYLIFQTTVLWDSGIHILIYAYIVHVRSTFTHICTHTICNLAQYACTNEIWELHYIILQMSQRGRGGIPYLFVCQIYRRANHRVPHHRY